MILKIPKQYIFYVKYKPQTRILLKPSCSREKGVGGGGGGVDRCILAGEAMNLKFYDFSSNFVWNIGPAKRFWFVE